MDDAKFEERMSAMEGEIESLDIPPDEKAALRRMAAETRARHAGIRETAGAGREAVRMLDEAVRELLGSVAGMAERAKELEGAAADASLAAKLAQFNREARDRELRGEGRNHDG